MLTLLKIGDDGYSVRVSLPDGAGTVLYEFSDVECYRQDEINCVVRAEWFIEDKPVKSLSGRMNIQSPSARNGFIKDISDISGYSLKESFLDATERIKQELTERDESHWFEESTSESAEMLFEPFLVRGAANLIFGMGEGAKTYTCLRLALSLATGRPFVGYTPKHRVKTLFVDYEDTSATCGDRLNKLLSSQAFKGVPLEDVQKSIRYLNPRGMSIPVIIKQLKKIVEENDIGLVLIDSAVSAGDGKPEDSDVVKRYFNALSKLGVTTLTIAHETKSENHKYPFGSIFWFNFPRSIWNVRAIHEGAEEVPTGSSVIETGLFHRKANNGPRFPHIPLKVSFDPAFVDISTGNAALWDGERDVKNRILSLLKDRMLTRTEIGDELVDVPPKTVETELYELKKQGRVELLGTKGSPYKLAKKSSLPPIKK